MGVLYDKDKYMKIRTIYIENMQIMTMWNEWMKVGVKSSTVGAKRERVPVNENVYTVHYEL